MKVEQKKKLWKNIFEGKYAIEKRVKGKYHEYRKIGDFKTTLEYCKNYQEYLQRENMDSGTSDGVYLIYDVLKNNKEINDENLEIFFGFMNDEFWYPKDCTDSEAIENYWLDTIILVSKDRKVLKKLFDLFYVEWNNKDNQIYPATGKLVKDEYTFDEVDIVDFPDGRHAVRLWMD